MCEKYVHDTENVWVVINALYTLFCHNSFALYYYYAYCRLAFVNILSCVLFLLFCFSSSGMWWKTTENIVTTKAPWRRRGGSPWKLCCDCRWASGICLPLTLALMTLLWYKTTADCDYAHNSRLDNVLWVNGRGRNFYRQSLNKTWMAGHKIAMQRFNICLWPWLC